MYRKICLLLFFCIENEQGTETYASIFDRVTANMMLNISLKHKNSLQANDFLVNESS